MVRAKGGRKKIEITRLKNDINLQITFSKRKHCVFKKASELSTLCGVEIGVIVFSPGQKAFSFGNPDIRSVLNRFKKHLHDPLRLIENGPNVTIQTLNNKLTQEATKLEMEKDNKKSLDQIENMREETENWWNKPLNQFDLAQTTSLIKALENLKAELRSQQPQHMQTVVPQTYYGASYNNIADGGNINHFDQKRIINHFDQKRMIDVNAKNYNPNMIIPNHGSMFGYNNNNTFCKGFPPF